jgi:dipeptidyl aminopeptidase/acylaminoacyl peptidase
MLLAKHCAFSATLSAVLLCSTAHAQTTTAATPSTRVAQTTQSASARNGLITPADIKAWNSLRQPTLSNDGRWFAYTVGPADGDATLVLRGTARSADEKRINVGDGGGSLQISGDSKWLGFIVAPPKPPAAAERNGRGRRGADADRDSADDRGNSARSSSTAKQTANRFVLMNLATGATKEFERIRRFSFNGDHATWVALSGYGTADSDDDNGGRSGGRAGGGRGRGGFGAPAGGSVDGGSTALLLYNLDTGEMINMGVVGEYAFNKDGSWLAYTMETPDRVGNGVQLRNMKTGATHSVDNDRAVFRHLAWVDSARALSVMRGRVDQTTKDTTFSIELFTQLGPNGLAHTQVFDPTGRSDFPAGWKLASERAPRYSSDMSAVFFGLREIADTADARDPEARSAVQPGAPGTGGSINQGRRGVTGTSSDSLPTLILWHAKDPRLQSQQIVQEQQDRAYNYLSLYRLEDDRFIRLANDSLRNVVLTTNNRYAYGMDTRAYDQEASYSGRRYQDVYRIDLRTGERTPLLQKQPSGGMTASPDGARLLFWGTNGHWYVLDLATGDTVNITRSVPTSFIDSTDDHNNLFPPSNRSLGWSRDGRYVLLDDGWDIWKVPAQPGRGEAVNLTMDGRAKQVHYQRLYEFTTGPVEPTLPGIDLSKPLYFGTYGEWTKKEGLSRVDPNKPGAKSLLFEDAKFDIIKARDADTYAYTRQTFTEYPNYWMFESGFKPGYQITDVNPQMKDLAWSSGTRLIDYVSDKGDRLQGALYLPANYEPGKKYPMLVTIYEKRSQNKNRFVSPSETRTPDPTLYTNRGYIVFDPDIVYKVNDPGMSAVWSVVPAVKAAIATGMVDPAKVGLWGHSWGGYQTAFLVTQTDIFAAAIAGAPLTDMVSMYSSIYWNTGGANQAIFESSQGRFKGNFIDNYDAYIRNSPAFHAKNVKTPLIILHNDKDGAVDFNQGITYFNTLRQLGKEVIMLEYVGENHGLSRAVNQKDYAIRMSEWFDNKLKHLPAAEWIEKGIPRLQMEAHLRARKDAAAAPVIY